MTDEEMNRLLNAARQHFGETTDRLTAENRGFFEVSAKATRREIGVIAKKVTRLDQKLDHHIDELGSRIERGFAETQATTK